MDAGRGTVSHPLPAEDVQGWVPSVGDAGAEELKFGVPLSPSICDLGDTGSQLVSPGRQERLE